MHVLAYFCNCPHKDSSLSHTETICLLAVVALSLHVDAVISSGKLGAVVSTVLSSLFPKWWHPVQCWPLNFVGLSFVRVTLGFKDWRAENDTRATFECAFTHTHTHCWLFGMRSQRVNRVTSSAPCSVLKLSTPETCATYQDIYMILSILCQRPLLTLKPWHLFALPVAMKVAWRWFSSGEG